MIRGMILQVISILSTYRITCLWDCPCVRCRRHGSLGHLSSDQELVGTIKQAQMAGKDRIAARPYMELGASNHADIPATPPGFDPTGRRKCVKAEPQGLEPMVVVTWWVTNLAILGASHCTVFLQKPCERFRESFQSWWRCPAATQKRHRSRLEMVVLLLHFNQTLAPCWKIA